MLHFLPPILLAGLSLLLYLINTIFWCLPVYALALLKVIFPLQVFQRICARAMTGLAQGWVWGLRVVIRLTQKIEWDVRGKEGLRREGWYLLVCNHQSWVDIIVLQQFFHGRIPSLKFFVKKELLRLPFLGVAMRALDFPFVERYSREVLEKHPELRGRDLETVRRSCERFRQAAAAIVIFPEGTRFTPEKHDVQQSPYRHLLRPKTGGLSATMAALGDRIDSLLDVTIVYPDGRPTFWDFLSGRISRAVVRVQPHPIPPELRTGNCPADPRCREGFNKWMGELWGEKDARIEGFLRQLE
ncbi:acyltransferase [Desulfuromonas sp. TF]|uniref:acyltransferase n=1 Tax=Desulfuromonas sp. TF TaxID=1232410 RepID=UPI000408D239|nr:acyltransferase [Desulfuromonas sp. TF]